jgi:hypothetical protein
MALFARVVGYRGPYTVEIATTRPYLISLQSEICNSDQLHSLPENFRDQLQRGNQYPVPATLHLLVLNSSNVPNL